MPLKTAIEQARRCQDNPPPNEATTCYRVIDPLLRVLGYESEEILIQGSDGQGQKPDYTILPGTGAEWFLEAKAWSVTLADTHAGQALNYANQNGRRWVGLSNGREWRLYDNDIRGTAAEKLVATARLAEDSEIEPFLGAISKESVTTGQLESQARGFRLSSVLDAQMKDPNSDVVKAIAKALRSKGLTVRGGDIVGWFESRRKPVDDGGVIVPPLPSPTPPPIPGGERKSLAEWREIGQEGLRFRKPVLLEFPNGVTVRPGRLNEVDVEMVKWLFSIGRLPALPWRVGRWLLLAESEEAFQTLGSSPKRAECDGKDVYVETAFQASNHVWLWKILCDQAQVPLTGVFITLTPQSIPQTAV